jgi:hypothetical protein
MMQSTATHIGAAKPKLAEEVKFLSGNNKTWMKPAG